MLIALPMFGDYYTPDLMSGSPKTSMLGNTINGYVQGGPDKSLGAALTLLLARVPARLHALLPALAARESGTRERAAQPAGASRAGWRS